MMWNDLTMAQKNELMKTYIKAGVKDLPSMISHYNSYANGGPKKTYQEWASQMQQKYPWLEMNSANAGYDYERYFNENYDDALSRLTEPEARHFTDKYKLPSHITFSDESVYSTPKTKGGRWVGDDMFMPSPTNVERYPWLYKAYRPVSEEDIYGHRFEEGGPEEELYSAGTLPKVAITASRIYDKDFEKTYKKYGKYAGISNKSQAYNRWLNDQGKLDVIKAKREEASKRALGVTAVGAALPFVTAGAIQAAPVVTKILNNPIVDAALTTESVVHIPKNIKNAAQDFREGNNWKGVGKLGLTALDLYGAGNLLYRTGRILNPAYRAKHAFNTIPPVGYKGKKERIKEYAKDLWNNPSIDYSNPKWYKNMKEDFYNDGIYFEPIEGATGTGTYLAKNIENAGEIADKARIDAWAIYNGLPQQYGTYIKNIDGTYSYDMDRIMRISNNTWYPKSAPVKNANNLPAGDFVTGAGGNLTNFELIGEGTHGNGLMRIEDTWDVHPFSRQDDRVVSKINDFIHKRTKKLKDLSWKYYKKFGYDEKAYKRELANYEKEFGDMNITDLDDGVYISDIRPDIIDFPTTGLKRKTADKIYKRYKKLGNEDVSKIKAIKSLDKKIADFEIGRIVGGRPFHMRTDIPFYNRNATDNILDGITEIPDILLKETQKGRKLPDNLIYGYNPNYINDIQHLFNIDGPNIN